MAKRTYFIISSFFLTILFFLLNLVSYQWRYGGIIGFAVGVGLYQFVLFFGMVKNKTNLIASLFLPLFFVLGISLFRFLFAVNWIWQLVLVLVFLLGIYTIFLVENVFLVSTEIKTVPLYRAANTIGFLLTLISAFFIYEIIFSFRLSGWQNSLLVFVGSLPLLVHLFWFTNLGDPFRLKILVPALLFSLILGEMSLSMSFWPLGTTKAALYLVSLLYIFVGLAQAYCDGKLFKKTIKEFIWVGLGTFLALLLITSWRGGF